MQVKRKNYGTVLSAAIKLQWRRTLHHCIFIEPFSKLDLNHGLNCLLRFYRIVES
jgi:hypothetical protein